VYSIKRRRHSGDIPVFGTMIFQRTLEKQGAMLWVGVNWLRIKSTGGVLLTYLLTPWSRVLLEKLTGLQLFKKFPAFYGTRRFLTALTSARHLSLS
jgi:hypothetical protein